MTDLGINEILFALRELVAPTNPYTRAESERMVREVPDMAKNALTTAVSPLAALIPGVTMKELNDSLEADRREMAGFGGPLAGVSGKAGRAALTIKAARGVGKRVKKVKGLLGKRKVTPAKTDFKLDPETIEKMRKFFEGHKPPPPPTPYSETIEKMRKFFEGTK